MKTVYQKLRDFRVNEDGLVTIEWVGIAAAVVLASIVISSYLLQSASGLGGAVADKLDAAAEEVSEEE